MKYIRTTCGHEGYDTKWSKYLIYEGHVWLVSNTYASHSVQSMETTQKIIDEIKEEANGVYEVIDISEVFFNYGSYYPYAK